MIKRAGWEPFFVALLAIGSWQLVTSLSEIPQLLLPSPLDVWKAFTGNLGTLWEEGLVTGYETLVGITTGVLLGWVSAIAIFWFPYLKRTLYPVMFGIRIVPKVAFVPLFMIWLGTGIGMKTALTALGIFFIFLVQTLVGLASTEPEMLELARSLGMKKGRTLWRLRMPSALPSIMVGVRLGIAYGLTMVIVGEMVVSDRGFGAMIMESSTSLRTAETFSTIIVVSLAGLILYGLATLLDKRLTSWYSQDGK